jgi:hypothetical protein
MKNKPKNIPHGDLKFHYFKENENKNFHKTINDKSKEFKDFSYKNNFNKKIEEKKYHKGKLKKLSKSYNNKMPKYYKNNFDLNEINDETNDISNHQKKEFEIINTNIHDKNNEFYKKVKKNIFNQEKLKNDQNIIINSINEIRLPRELYDISCDIIQYK